MGKARKRAAGARKAVVSGAGEARLAPAETPEDARPHIIWAWIMMIVAFVRGEPRKPVRARKGAHTRRKRNAKRRRKPRAGKNARRRKARGTAAPLHK
jgi:hypothetical protein